MITAHHQTWSHQHTHTMGNHSNQPIQCKHCNPTLSHILHLNYHWLLHTTKHAWSHQHTHTMGNHSNQPIQCKHCNLTLSHILHSHARWDMCYKFVLGNYIILKPTSNRNLSPSSTQELVHSLSHNPVFLIRASE